MPLFPRGRTVVLLDNFEEVVDSAGNLLDEELNDALQALLAAPEHGIKVIITTRVAPKALQLTQPGRQTLLELDKGLESPFAENILKAMDTDGKLGLRDAPDALLALARERTLGYPRALEALQAILAADRSTTLEEVLAESESVLPENVVEALVGEAFSRLDTQAQQAMQALAILAAPVPEAAVDYLLQPYAPDINSTPILRRLVNMLFARREGGRFHLHQVDRSYALERVPKGESRPTGKQNHYPSPATPCCIGRPSTSSRSDPPERAGRASATWRRSWRNSRCGLQATNTMPRSRCCSRSTSTISCFGAMHAFWPNCTSA
jgi:hypothetical protein